MIINARQMGMIEPNVRITNDTNAEGEKAGQEWSGTSKG